MNKIAKSHIALVIATIIFGLHYTIAKQAMPVPFRPLQLLFFRMLGSVILFWILQKFYAPEKVERKDMFTLAICGFFGFAANQALFYIGLNLTTPVDASLIHVLNPILVMIFASIVLSEKITRIRLGGVALGASGALILVLYGKIIDLGSTTTEGNIIVMVNMLFYAMYIVMVKPMVEKYHITTVMKWISLYGFIVIIPFAFKPMTQFQLVQLNTSAWLTLFYVIVINTFIAYLLLNFALRHVDAGAVGYYTYIQPILASVTSVSLGTGTITIPKVIAAVLIFGGVYMVNRK